MSKVIFKMTFKHPNRPDTTSKNMSHVAYISSRPGVDKTITESDLKKELEKGLEELSSDDETYIKYIDERPRSHGLFGKDGLEDPKDVQEEVGNVNSFVWRGIVSLAESDARSLGYMDKENWQNMLRAKVPEMASKMEIRPSNLRWVAAVHMEKGHPHAHIMFWEKEPERTIGIVRPKILDNIRKLYTDEIFEEQRLELITEKNTMRDLIKDLANDDISKTSRLIKEIKNAGFELNKILGEESQENIAPRLYSQEEKELINKIRELSEIVPGKGRIALKFMPENVKEEVRAIADYLLSKPEFSASLEKNLRATEELAKLYTGKEDDLNKVRENAYNDIRDRVCQTVLKGAVQLNKDNLFYVDRELSANAVEFIKSIDSQISLSSDYERVIKEISTALLKTGHDDEQVLKNVVIFNENEKLNLSQEKIEQYIDETKEVLFNNNSINSLSFKKNVEYYLSILKLSGYQEDEAFSILSNTIKSDSYNFDNSLQKLKEEGILKKVGEEYKLTNEGIEEFLKVKELDRAEKEILTKLEKNEGEIKKVSFDELIDSKDIFDNLYNKDPKEFRLQKYDTKVRDILGDKNNISFKELEELIYGKYSNNELVINSEKAEIEIELLEKRIEKLSLNGYIKFDKKSETYSFTDEANSYFEYNDKKEGYVFTDKAIRKFEIKKFEFTRYDANVTLSYIDKAKDNILTLESLKETLEKEIVNQEAALCYENFESILESGQAESYISINESGELISTKEGKELGKALGKLSKCFYVCKGSITTEKLKEYCNKEFGEYSDKQIYNISKQLEEGLKKGYIIKDKENSYKIDPVFKDINKLLYQIYKENGKIDRNELKAILEKNIPNKDAEKQFNYLEYRLNNLKKIGYLEGEDEQYKLTNEGIEKRKDILMPERDLLKEKLHYLKRLGLLEGEEGEYQATSKYYSYMKNISIMKENKIVRSSDIITKDIANIIDKTQDKVNVGKTERTNERIANGKYINGEYQELKVTYDEIRKYCNVPDTIEKTLKNISTALMVSGVEIEECQNILKEWNLKSNSNIDIEKIKEIIEKSYEVVKENDLWGQVTMISAKDWKNMFEGFNIEECDIPKWIYKGENWRNVNHGIGIPSMVNEIWKAAWREIEMERMRAQAQVQYMKKQLLKQQSSQSKSAIVEQIRKNKDRGSMYQDDFEM